MSWNHSKCTNKINNKNNKPEFKLLIDTLKPNYFSLLIDELTDFNSIIHLAIYTLILKFDCTANNNHNVIDRK